jgi:hypothetical protein
MHTDPAQWSDIRRRVLVDGEPIRGVARSDGLSRNTVRKMLRHDRLPKYIRASSPTLITGWERKIDAILIEEDTRPQRERRSVAAIFRLLRDDHSYVGGYGSVRRYCMDVRIPEINLTVRTAGVIGPTDSLTITEGPAPINSPRNRREGLRP